MPHTLKSRKKDIKAPFATNQFLFPQGNQCYIGSITQKNTINSFEYPAWNWEYSVGLYRTNQSLSTWQWFLCQISCKTKNLCIDLWYLWSADVQPILRKALGSLLNLSCNMIHSPISANELLRYYCEVNSWIGWPLQYNMLLKRPHLLQLKFFYVQFIVLSHLWILRVVMRVS